MNRPAFVRTAAVFLMGGVYSLFLMNAGAQAQVPAQADPGLIQPTPAEKTQEEEQTRQKLQPLSQQQPARVDINVPQPSPVVQVQQASFQVNRIVLEGVTVFSPERLQALTRPYEGRELTLNELEQAVSQINTLYREAGYLTSQAYIPPQNVEGGTVKINVLEGRVGSVCLKGNRFYRSETVLGQLSVKEGQVFNLKDFQDALNTSNRVNNYRLKAALSPGDRPGVTNVMLESSEPLNWQVSPTVDNQGRPYIGTIRGGVDVTNDSLLGYGDRLTGSYRGAAGTQMFLGSYFFPLNKRGDELGLSYGYSHVDVDLGVPGQDDIDGVAHSINLLWSHPFDRQRKWVGDVGLNGRRIQTLVNDQQDDLNEIRSLQAGLSFSDDDALGLTYARVQTSHAMNILGGNTSFWKLEGFLNRVFYLPANNFLIVRAFGQYTPNDLPAAEAFQLGGAYSVRGYTEGLLVGDRGYSLSVEERFPFPFIGSLFPSLKDRVQGAVFFDVGQTWLDSSSPRYVAGVSNTSQRTLLMGAGVGLRARLTQYLQGFIDVGFGLVDRSGVEPNADPTARIHFGVRSYLLPELAKPRSDKVQCLPASQRK